MGLSYPASRRLNVPTQGAYVTDETQTYVEDELNSLMNTPEFVSAQKALVQEAEAKRHDNLAQ